LSEPVWSTSATKWYVVSVPWLIAIGTMRGDSLSIAGMNYTGFLWMFAMIIGVVLFIVELGLRPTIRMCFPAIPWLLWLAYVACSLTWTDRPDSTLYREALQYCMPVLTAILVSAFVQTREQLAQFLRTFYWLIPAFWMLAGLWYFFDLEQTLRDDVFVEVRGLAIGAVVAAAVFISEPPGHRLRGWIGWSACLVLAIATGSRMAGAAILLLPILNPVTQSFFRRCMLLALIAVGTLGLFLTPMVQQRFFEGGTGSVDRLVQGDFDSSGRFDAWPILLEAARERPGLGHGVGTAQRLVPEVWEGVAAPHNDYLRLAHDFGVTGLVLYLSLIAWQMGSLLRRTRRTEGVVRQAFGASLLGLVAFLIIAYTDNPVMYIMIFMDPIFALMGAAYAVAWHESREFEARWYANDSWRRNSAFLIPTARS
jgi:hypothetical protein